MPCASQVGCRRRIVFKDLSGDLDGHHGASVIIPGDHQPPVVHALCARNERQTWAMSARRFSTPIPFSLFTGNHNDSLKDLVADMRAGKVDLLVILGGNPVLRRARRSSVSQTR